jgi:hypothetical protein
MFDSNWCMKYLSTTFSILKVLALDEDVHLGALGDHFLEHFFGSIRSHSNNSHTPTSYERFLKNTMLEEEIRDKFSIERDKTHTMDSGVVDTDRLIHVNPIGIHLGRALKIHRTMNEITQSPLFFGIDMWYDKKERWTIKKLTKSYNLNTHIVKRRTSNSTRIIATGGLCNMKRYISHNQI